MKTYVKISLFIVFFLALAAILAALYYYNLKPKDLTKAKPDFVMTSEQIVKEFDNNEKAASSKYVKKILEVSGEVSSVSHGEKNTLNVSLKSGNAVSFVNCTFPVMPDTTRLKMGETVTIRGVCSGYLTDVLLNNCVLVPNR